WPSCRSRRSSWAPSGPARTRRSRSPPSGSARRRYGRSGAWSDVLLFYYAERVKLTGTKGYFHKSRPARGLADFARPPGRAADEYSHGADRRDGDGPPGGAALGGGTPDHGQ